MLVFKFAAAAWLTAEDPRLTVDSHPFFVINVFWKHDDRLETSLDQRTPHKRVAHVQWLITRT
jgi:hypothetical protein